MAYFSIDHFRKNVPGIARATLFDVKVTFPHVSGLFDTEVFAFTCKTASIPSSTFGKIEVPYMGRKIYFAGDRQYNEWNTTVIIDNDWTSYKNIYKWHQMMNSSRYNVSTFGQNNSYDMNFYKGIAEITAWSQDGVTPKLTMRLDGFFPTDMQEVQMDWSNVDATADLQVVWSYDFSELINGEELRYRSIDRSSYDISR